MCARVCACVSACVGPVVGADIKSIMMVTKGHLKGRGVRGEERGKVNMW